MLNAVLFQPFVFKISIIYGSVRLPGRADKQSCMPNAITSKDWLFVTLWFNSTIGEIRTPCSKDWAVTDVRPSRSNLEYISQPLVFVLVPRC